MSFWWTLGLPTRSSKMSYGRSCWTRRARTWASACSSTCAKATTTAITSSRPSWPIICAGTPSGCLNLMRRLRCLHDLGEDAAHVLRVHEEDERSVGADARLAEDAGALGLELS